VSLPRELGVDVGMHVHRAFEGTRLRPCAASGRLPIFSGGLPIFFANPGARR
jgi:hypothetical protein